MIAAHRVRLPAARHPIRKQKSILSVEHVLHERQADLLKDLLLGGELVVDLSERVDQLFDLARSVRGRALSNKLNRLNKRSLQQQKKQTKQFSSPPVFEALDCSRRVFSSSSHRSLCPLTV